MRIGRASLFIAQSVLTILVSGPAFGAFAELKWKLQPLCVDSPLQEGFRICESAGRQVVEYYESDKLLGQVKAFMDKGDPTIFVERIHVEKSLNNNGISKRLFQKLLEIGGSEIKWITAELAYDNFEAIVKTAEAMSRSGRPELIDVSQHERMKIAAKGTPFVKAWSKLGFSVVID